MKQFSLKIQNNPVFNLAYLLKGRPIKQSDFYKALENEAPAHLRNSSSLEHAFKLVKSIDDRFAFHSQPDIIRLAERIQVNSLPDDHDIFGIEVRVKISHMALVASDYLVGITGGN